jgi:hypothetical protein
MKPNNRNQDAVCSCWRIALPIKRECSHAAESLQQWDSPSAISQFCSHRIAWSRFMFADYDDPLSL